MSEQTMYNVWRTAVEMLQDRGYVVGKELQEYAASIDRWKERYGGEPDFVSLESLTILGTHQDDPTEQILVFFPDEPKVGVKPVKKYAERMRDEGVSHAILVVQDKLTPFARQCLNELAPKYRVETFTSAELRVNISKHEMVPRHTLLTRAERTQLLERYNVKDTQLPRIQHNDPVARYYGIDRGQVVRIVRASESAGRYVTYRLCV